MPIIGVSSLHKHSPANFILLHTLHWKDNSAILYSWRNLAVCVEHGPWNMGCVTQAAALPSPGLGLGLHSSGVAAFGAPGVCQLNEPSKDSRNNSDFYAILTFMQMQNRQKIQPAFKICTAQISPARFLSTSMSRLLSLSSAIVLLCCLPLTNI